MMKKTKKILALLVCFMMMFSCASLVSATGYSEAQAAAEKLINYFYQTLYPLNTKSDFEDVFLADLDYDGIPELLCSKNLRANGLTVYQYQSGKILEASQSVRFGYEFGMHQQTSLLMDEDGHIYIYRDYAFYVPTGEGSNTRQAIYRWSEDDLIPLAYLDITNSYTANATTSTYTTDLNAESDSSIPKTAISPEEAGAKFREFENQVKPYIIWSDTDTDRNSGLNRIWIQQKQRYAKSSVWADSYAILQIGNPMMNANGFSKPIDGENDTVPMILNNRTMIPVRAVVEELGGSVSWDDETRTVTLSGSGITIKLVIDSTTAYVNDMAQTLDVAPVIQNNRTMFPARFIAENFGYSVTWKAGSQEIVIAKTNVPVEKSASVNETLLSCIGKTKAEIEGMYGNIVDSDYFDGGEFHRHSQLTSWMDYGLIPTTIDAMDPSTECYVLYASLSDLLNTPYKTQYTIEELYEIFGDCEFTNSLSIEEFPAVTYDFTYGDYRINVISGGLYPTVEYVTVFQN